MRARQAKGKNINGLLNLQADETVKAFLQLRNSFRIALL